jgi:hypothetical protein
MLDVELLYYSAIILLGIYPREITTYVLYTNIHSCFIYASRTGPKALQLINENKNIYP